MKYVFTTLVLATLAAGDCVADDCLRALRSTQTPGRSGAAQEFCATFTQGSDASTAIPSYALDACKQNQDAPLSVRLSSACNCIAATSTSFGSSATASPTKPASASSTSITSTSTSASASLIPACALVSSSSSVQIAAFPTVTPIVSAQLALECLNSVPLNKTGALRLVDGMIPYLEWQSDTAWKKDPPADYYYPPHDIFGYLASVKANLQADKYANEYAFQEDLYQVFARSHDGHFAFYPDALTKAFDWGRKRSLVSISEDGTSLPVIKLYEDVISSPSTASVVTQINGVEASKYVADFIFIASLNQDADAAYNSMFYDKAFAAAGIGNGYFSSGGRSKYIYPGSMTTFTFANGTTLVTENIAKVKGLFAAVTDGASFYKRFCTGPKSFLSAEAPESTVKEKEIEVELAAAAGVAEGYPDPIRITSDGIFSGYYLNGTGFEDVAAISVLAFDPESFVEFQTVARQFFATAKRDGKTKLVIDLSGNGGGTILQGYDLFRQLFPTIIQEGNSRLKESDTLLAIAEIASANSANFNPHNATTDVINQHQSVFNYRYDLNQTNQPFSTFLDKFGPKVIKGEKYTELIRWNLDDPLTTVNRTFGMGADVTGYGTKKNFTQPFAAENIIMLLDGFCASTCTLFTEFMRTQAGVKSIAMGGRPKAGPIQGVGGIKGAQVLHWSDIFSMSRTALHNASEAQAAIIGRLTSYPLIRSSASSVNARDHILPNNFNDGLPAQFVREEAECRLYYTQPMITDVTALWKAAANSAFNGAKCNAGGLSKREIGTESVEKRRVQTPTMKKPLQKRSIKKLAAEWLARHGRKIIT